MTAFLKNKIKTALEGSTNTLNGKRIVKYLIDIKGKILDMIPDKMYAGIDVTNIRCKHLFEKLGFELVGQPDDNDFLYYELKMGN